MDDCLRTLGNARASLSSQEALLLAPCAGALLREVEGGDLGREALLALLPLAPSWEELPGEEPFRPLRLLARAVLDRLAEEDPAFREALARPLGEESHPFTREELEALVLEAGEEVGL